MATSSLSGKYKRTVSLLLERLAMKPVARGDLEKTIAEALDGHLCRCTGYIKYHEAVRDVILAEPGRYLITTADLR